MMQSDVWRLNSRVTKIETNTAKIIRLRQHMTIVNERRSLANELEASEDKGIFPSKADTAYQAYSRAVNRHIVYRISNDVATL